MTALVLDLFYSAWHEVMIMGLPMILGLAAFLPYILLQLLGNELNTIYIVIPASRAGGLGSKLLALFTQYVLVLLGGIILAFLLFPEPGLAETLNQARALGIDTRLQTIVSSGSLFYLMSVVGMAYVIAISFFSQLLGKLVRRFSGPVTAIVFIATFWLMNKLMTPLWQQLWNYNQLHMNQYNFSVAALNQLVGMNTLIVLSGTVIVFIAAVLVYNHKIEL